MHELHTSIPDDVVRYVEAVSNVFQLSDGVERRILNACDGAVDLSCILGRALVVMRECKHVVSVRAVQKQFGKVPSFSPNAYRDAPYEEFLNRYASGMNFPTACAIKAIVRAAVDENVIGGRNPIPFVFAAAELVGVTISANAAATQRALRLLRMHWNARIRPNVYKYAKGERTIHVLHNIKMYS